MEIVEEFLALKESVTSSFREDNLEAGIFLKSIHLHIKACQKNFHTCVGESDFSSRKCKCSYGI